MKKFLLSAFVLFSITLLSAQPPDRFIKYYYPEPNVGSRVDDVIATDYGYMLTGTIIDSTDAGIYYWKRCFLGIDFDGEVLWEKNYGDEYFRYSSYGNKRDCFIHDGLSYFYLSPVLEVTNLELGEYIECSQLLKLTNTGDTLWTKNYYGDEEWPILILTTPTLLPDGGFSLIGSRGRPANIGNEYMTCFLRIDSLGNELWRQSYYGSMGNFYASLYDQVTKRHILAGHKYTTSNTNAHIGVIDSLGNLLQNKTLVSKGLFSDIKQQSDGAFVACGLKYTKKIHESIELQKPLIVKFDADLNVIWKKEYGEDQLYNNFYFMDILPGDTIVAMGFIDTLFNHGLSSRTSILLSKLTPDGNIIWSRMIWVDEDFALNGVCRSLTRATNGGYAMTVSTETFVLIKVDEYGCIEEGCQENDVGITGPKDVAKLFRVYPNPAKEYAIFEFRGYFGGQAQVELQNIAGQVVDRFELRSSQYQYPASNLEQGIYLATLKVDGKKVATEKVIILK